MQMPTINLMDFGSHALQFLLVLFMLFCMVFMVSIMFRGFFDLISGVVVLPTFGKKSRIDASEPTPRTMTFRKGVELTE
jgi:hypothetical protein